MKSLVFMLAALAALAAPAAASAHPLGNFTINRFSRIESAAQRAYVLYVLDMAEIPTYQAGTIDAGAYAKRLAAGARLQLDGRHVTLTPIVTALAHPKGAGGLHTTRLEVLLQGPRVDHTAKLAYTDTNYAGRIGWQEIVVGGQTRSESDELRAYPKNLLQSPLDVGSVRGELHPAGGPPPKLTTGKALQAPDRIADAGFSSLIGREHALSQFIVPDQLYPWLNLASGVLVVAIGATVFRSRIRHRRAHGYDHHHHDHEAPSRGSLLAVGISGGLLPCPSALVVLLAAISLHRVAFGMLLIVAFSAGLALSITGIGLVAVFAKQIFKRASFEGRLVKLLPAASAIVILGAGLAMTARALPKVT